jgi:signal transduction histidine kinase
VLQLAAEVLEEHARLQSLDPQKLNKYIAIMKQNTYRLSKLVGNLLDVTKIDAGFMQPVAAAVDIVALIRNLVDSVKPFAAKRGLKMAFLCRRKSKVVQTDAEYVERIVINLLSNAIKHTPRGGTVNVACEDRADSIVISVRDNGEGIPDEKKEIIFDRFRQVNNSLARSSEGCGIGLSLCRSLAELLGGRVWLSSQPGRGSEFFVGLPTKLADGTAPNISVQPTNLQSRIQTEFSDINF